MLVGVTGVLEMAISTETSRTNHDRFCKYFMQSVCLLKFKLWIHEFVRVHHMLIRFSIYMEILITRGRTSMELHLC